MIDIYVRAVPEVIKLSLLQLILILHELVRLGAYTLCYPDNRYEGRRNLIV